jgi:hypothetical protein
MGRFFFTLIRREGAPPTTKQMHPLLTGFCGRRSLAAKGFPIPFRLSRRVQAMDGLDKGNSYMKREKLRLFQAKEQK